MSVKIKICGMTRAGDAVAARELGVEYLGLNFVGGPRKITLEHAKSIMDAVRNDDGPGEERRVRVVALCAATGDMRTNPLTWYEMPTRSPHMPDAFQLYAADYGVVEKEPVLNGRWWMVAGVARRSSLVEMAVAVGVLRTMPAAIVLDTAVAGKLGGTGQSFDWNWIAEARQAGELQGLPPIILAGGLTPDNVAEAIRIVRPYAVDVSSGVEEKGKPGVKDVIKMRDFVQAVRGA